MKRKEGNDNNDKLIFLYKYAKDVLKDEEENFKRIDTKANLYFSFVSFLIGIYFFILKEMLENFKIPNTCFGFLIYILIASFTIYLTFVLLNAWIKIFKSVKMRNLTQLPLDEKDLNWYNKKTLSDIYNHCIKLCVDILQHNSKVRNDKTIYLEKAESEIDKAKNIIIVLLILIFINLLYKTINSEFLSNLKIFFGR